MVKLEVNISRRYFRLWDYNLKMSIPTSWSEVGEMHIHHLSLLEVLRSQPQWKQYVTHYLFGDKLTNIPYKEVEEKILPLLEFIDQPFPSGVVKKFIIGKRIFWARIFGHKLSIKTPFNQYLLQPKTSLSDMRMDEYVNAMKQLTLYYNSNGKTKHLTAFVACLLREPANYNNPVERKTFNADDMSSYLETVEKLPLQHQQFVMNEFINEIDKIRKVPKFKNLFPQVQDNDDDEEETKIENKTRGIQDPNSYYDFLISVSESGIFGSYDQTQKAKVLDVFFAMAKKNQDAITAQINNRS